MSEKEPRQDLPTSVYIAGLALVGAGALYAGNAIYQAEKNTPEPTNYEQMRDDLLGSNSAPAPRNDLVNQVPDIAVGGEFATPVPENPQH